MSSEPNTVNEKAVGFLKSRLLTGGWYEWRLRRKRLPGVLVLCYHGIRGSSWRYRDEVFSNLHLDSALFEAHCRLLAECCHPISVHEWRESARTGRPLPDRAVLVTFDDGYRSVYESARPILKRYRIPALMFVCSQPIRRQELLWFDALAREAGESAVTDFLTRTRSERPSAWRTPKPADASDPLAPMTIDQLKALADDGFEIGVHTASHVHLASTTQADQITELSDCRDSIAAWIGQPATAVAYPWGQPGRDYTQETVVIAERLGFDFGFTTRSEFARPDEPPLERSRFVVLASVQPAELAHRITYSWR